MTAIAMPARNPLVRVPTLHGFAGLEQTLGRLGGDPVTNS
jgi:hypothetical protein